VSERDKYLKAYYENEYDANRQMAFALLASAIILVIVWIGYLTDIFVLTQSTRTLTNIVIPIVVVILLTPLFWIRTERVRKPGFKYFVLFSYVFVMAILNVIMPKHAIIGWAVCVVLTNHYYNPKVGRIVFAVTLLSMLICIYLAMFLGEYDPNLLMGELDEKTSLIHHYSDYNLTFPDTIQGRYEYLSYLKSIGRNRYLTAFVFYYLARAALLSILSLVSNGLNKRTYKLLRDEILVAGEQEKTKTELEVAKEIQLATLPIDLYASEDIEMQAELRAAKEVGGDFYDYFQLDDDNIAIVIGDVSGKGIPAAMFMMKTITCFKNYVSIDKSPSTILKEVNRTIYDRNDSQMFVTCFFAIVNTKTGLVKYANAGHNPPIVGHNRHFHYLKCQSGFVLGGLEEAFVTDEEYQLEKGDVITLYTDGITEAKNTENELYGEQRLIDFYNSKDFSCLLELHLDLKDSLDQFANGADQADDITYLTIKYHGDKYAYEEKIYKATRDNVPLMLDFLRSFATEKGFEANFIDSLSIVGDEIISNIVKYGYPEEVGDIFLRLLYNVDKKEFVFTIIDQGTAFNPLDVESKPLEGDANDYEEGGLGILIVKTLMSEHIYDRINNKNILILKKRF